MYIYVHKLFLETPKIVILMRTIYTLLMKKAILKKKTELKSTMTQVMMIMRIAMKRKIV